MCHNSSVGKHVEDCCLRTGTDDYAGAPAGNYDNIDFDKEYGVYTTNEGYVIAICGNNPDKGIKYRHTWNIVQINEKYYHLDATFDNTLTRNCTIGEEIRYDYFNLEDKSIFRDHEPLIAPAMKCTDGDHFYYKEKKLSFTKTEEVYKRALQMAKKGRILTFHWRGGYLTKTVLEELLDLIGKAGAEKGKKPRISLNWPQAVIRFGYVDAEIAGSSAAEEVQMEEANEGEMHSD